MKNQKVTKDNFVSLLEESILATPMMKQRLLLYAGQLVQSIDERSYGGEIDNPVVNRAVLLYLRANPERGNIPPSLPDLVRWLRGRRSLDYTAMLEKNLKKVHVLLDRLGEIDPDDQIIVSPDLILSLRVLSTFPDKTVQDD